MNNTFQALNKESSFTFQMLGAGVTEIRKANYAAKGIYFQSFTNLATGLERIGKLCLMLDFYIETGGKFPNKQQLKNDIGHNLEKLYKKSQEIIVNRSCDFDYLTSLDAVIYKNILSILSDFARGDRYSNIDLLVGSSTSQDPVSRWHTEVDELIFQSDVSDKKKKNIKANAELIDAVMGPITMVVHTSETGEKITKLGDASYRTGIQEAVSPFRQKYVLHIIRYWSELLICLQYLAMDKGMQDIPFFSETFGLFISDDSYIRTRKTWGKF